MRPSSGFQMLAITHIKKTLGRLNWVRQKRSKKIKNKRKKLKKYVNKLTTPAGHVTRIKRKVAKG